MQQSTKFLPSWRASMRKAKRRIAVLAALLSLILLGWFFGPGSYGYQGYALANFNGRQFVNLVPNKDHSLADLIAWRWNRQPGDWQQRELPRADDALIARAAQGDLLVSFVTHATVLIQLDSLNVLTDPIWSEYTGPNQLFGARSYQNPGFSIDKLPPIDAVLLSHNHYDHMDLPTLRRLQALYQPVFIVGLGNRDYLVNAGLDRVVELNWWQQYQLNGHDIVYVPARHASMRTDAGYKQTLWGGFLLEGSQGSVVYAGDTGFSDHFSTIAQRYGKPRLAILPIGAYLPRWFMQENHMSPEDALAAFDALNARAAMAVHFGTFDLGDDGQDQARLVLSDLLALRADTREFWIPEVGQQRAF